jgi:hypothetical protein
MTSASSRVYDSRYSSRPGRGFPSCNTELCRLPVNRRDPHGYYAEIGVPPSAPAGEIRAAVRSLYRKLHPDTGGEPDPARLQRVKLIAEVLLDPAQRERYDRTPPGRRLLDGVYRLELGALDLARMEPDAVRRLLQPAPSPAPGPAGWYDYLAVDRESRDMLTAQHWYACLVAAAPLVGYRRRIKVMIHDGPPSFHPGTSVMAVPRRWRPSRGLAFALFVVVAGMRHPAWRAGDVVAAV